jgi:hypothetical protein
MKSRGFAVAVFVLALLAGVLYWSNNRKPTDAAANASADAHPHILALNRDNISKVEIKKKGADDVVLSKTAPDRWRITSPKPFNADADSISSVLSTLSSIDADRLVEEQAGDLKQFGLVEPTLEVSATMTDGKTQKLVIGDDTPTGSAAFAALAGNSRVFTVAGYTKTSLDKGVKDLRDKRLLPVDFNKITRVEIAGPNLKIAFGSENGKLSLQEPRDVRVNTAELDTAVEKLKGATLDVNASEEDRRRFASSFASGTPLATVKATDQSGSQEMQVRKNKDAYYAKSSGVEGVHKLSADLGAELEKKIDDFRNKNLFDSSSTDPEKVEMHDAGKTYSLTRSGNDWISDGKKMDEPSVESLLDQIRGLSATKFVSSGFAKPMTDITVTSDSGKRIEKVLVAKDGAAYIAKRENEALLYELDPKVFEDLQKAATQMKPAEPAKK